MRIIQVGTTYESKIYVIDDRKLIYRIDCLCGDFEFRRIKKHGKFNDLKYYAEPCKHLRPFIEALQKQGYKLKRPRKMEGFDYCPAPLRRYLLARAFGRCEMPGCTSEENLEIHRKIRKSNGGLYNKWNCKVLCSDHHRGTYGVHSGEFIKKS